ncbi:MAG TPA: gluconate 2-dehydrogenase subunit 3 family protein [Acidimicrobiales bacterium]|jgi:hypothetical protein
MLETGGRDVPVTLGRRTVVAGVGFLPLLRLLPRTRVAGALAAGAVAQPAELRFFDPHQAAVVTEATARLIPGPLDDPAETGFPGAREAGVVSYIDGFLSAFDEDPPRIYRTGPWSGRHGGDDMMGAFIPLTAWQEEAWRSRITEMQRVYREGIAALDAAAGGDFTAVDPATQDRILIELGGDAFRRVLFEHAIEGVYGAPEYRGNHDLVGWETIGYAGDIAPLGYSADEVEAEQPDPAPAGVELPFPPDMATTGTANPLGDLIADPDAWFGAAEPGIIRGRARWSRP